MSKFFLASALCALFFIVTVSAEAKPQTDTLKTSGGDLKITLLGHGSLMFDYGGKIIHVDPFGKIADYSKLPKADLILITHDHFDHLDPAALSKVRTKETPVVLTEACSKKVEGGLVMKNGDEKTVAGLKIQAVPAYNIVHKRDSGGAYHPKGRGNGYVITFGDRRVYVAGDTENIPEMKALDSIDVAFLPSNLPYTMTPEMVADAAGAFKPKVMYPYHYKFGKSDLPKLEKLMKDVDGVDTRLLNTN